MVNPFVAGSLVARYSFPEPIPLKFEHKLRNVTINKVLKKIATTVVLGKDEKLL